MHLFNVFYINLFLHYDNHIYILSEFKILEFLIASSMSSYPINTLFTEWNILWLVYELIRALEIKTSIVSNLVFANNTISACFFLFLNYWLTLFNYKIYISTAELSIPIAIPSKKAKAEIET